MSAIFTAVTEDTFAVIGFAIFAVLVYILIKRVFSKYYDALRRGSRHTRAARRKDSRTARPDFSKEKDCIPPEGMENADEPGGGRFPGSPGEMP